MTQLRDKISVSETGTGKTTTVLIICESRSPKWDVCVLMVHNNARDRKPEGWGLPGGGVRDGEELALAAIRELQEETGICLPDPSTWGLLKLGLFRNSPISSSHSRVVFKWPAWLPFMEGSFLVDDPGEGVVEACWVSYHEIHMAWQALQQGLPAVDSEGRRYYASHLRILYD